MIDNDYLSDEDFKKINYDELIADYDRKVANIKAQQEQQVPQEQNFQDYQYQQPQEEQQQVVDNQPQVEPQEFNNDVVNATPTTQQEQQQELNPEIYRQTYEKIYAPFKANGKEFQVRNVDEAISLMQKGFTSENRRA